jgi:hypothetical protein
MRRGSERIGESSSRLSSVFDISYLLNARSSRIGRRDCGGLGDNVRVIDCAEGPASPKCISDSVEGARRPPWNAYLAERTRDRWAELMHSPDQLRGTVASEAD